MPNTVGEHQLATFTTPAQNAALASAVVRGNFNDIGTEHNAHDDDGTIHVQYSALASRPAASAAANQFWVTQDTDGIYQFWYSTGSVWKEISGLTFTAVNGQPSLYDAGNSGTSLAIDWNNGPVQKVTLTSAATLTFTNAEAGGTYTLILVQGGSGGYAVTLTGWDFGANPPSYTTTVGAKNVVSGLYDGTEYLAAYAVQGA